MFTSGSFSYLQGSETIVLKEGEANDWDQKKLQAERVILTVKRFPKLPVDHVHGDICTEEKNHLERERDTWDLKKSFPGLFARLSQPPELETYGLVLCLRWNRWNVCAVPLSSCGPEPEANDRLSS